MTLQELAKLCVALNVYSKDTEETILRIAYLFEKRSGVSELSKIDAEALIRFKHSTLDRAKPVTYNGYLRYLKLLGNFAEEELIISDSPFKSQRPAPKSKPKPKIVNESTYIEAIRCLSDHPTRYEPSWFWQAIIRTFYYTGMRRRQLVSIKLKDINFSEMILTASISGSKTHREWDIPIHPKLASTLKQVITKSERSLGRPLKKNDYIFVIRRFNKRYAVNKNNPEQMKGRQITTLLARVSRQIDSNIGPHRLRHTTATVLCNPPEGFPDIFTAQEILGHANISTTRNYVQGNMQRKRCAMEQLSEPSI